MLKMIFKEEILTQLEAFRIAKGKPVLVHSSLRAIGTIQGGAKTLLSALREYFAIDQGLLCVPTHTWDGNGMDLRNPKSCLGALPTVAAGHPEGVRSLHPTHSMAVFGEEKRVREFVQDESTVDTPTGPDGCYGKLYTDDGYVLLVGVGHDKNTFIHCVEEMLGVTNRLTEDKTERYIIHLDGHVEERLLHWFDEEKIPDVSVYFGKFEPAFRYHGCILDGMLGNAKVQLCSAVKMKEVLELIYRRSHGMELLADDLPLEEALYK